MELYHPRYAKVLQLKWCHLVSAVIPLSMLYMLLYCTTSTPSTSPQLMGHVAPHARSAWENINEAAVARMREVRRQSANSSSLERVHTTSPSWDPPAALQTSHEIAQLGRSQGPSRSGKKWRIVLCANTRNELHLREWIVRNLLTGFSHIVLLDNNQVGINSDHNITLMVQPFVQADMVTHVPFMQDGSNSQLTNRQKHKKLQECYEKYGSQSDWVTTLDTDEILYIAKQPAEADAGQRPASAVAAEKAGDIGVLGSLLDAVEASDLNACAVFLPWRMMYGEHKVLQDTSLLLDAFPRQCFTHIPKAIVKVGSADPILPHYAQCKDSSSMRTISVDDAKFKKALPEYQVHLIHYYAKSVEEYILKSEQSMPPYFRHLYDAYDAAATTCSYKLMKYSHEHASAVRRMVANLRTAQGGLSDAGLRLGHTPEHRPGSRQDYALYVFFKHRVELGQEWEEDSYLEYNHGVREMISNRTIVDGLHHFMTVGYEQGTVTCWRQVHSRIGGEWNVGQVFCLA